MVKNASEIKIILKRYKSVLKKDRVRVTKMYLYGSYAKGQAHSHSDIDVIVVSPDLKRYSLLKRQEYLAVKTMSVDAPLEVIGYTPEEFNKSAGTIFGQIIRQTGKSV
jgi:predicted nucleotidyltransferase